MSRAIKEELEEKFGGRIRARVGGLLIENEKVLLLKHNYIGKDGFLWAPPGGGIEFGQSAEESICREFKEETGLEVSIMRFVGINEFIDPPLHALELFFQVKKRSGKVKLGFDPEMEKGQILSDLKYFSLEELKKMKKTQIHNIFHDIKSFESLFNTIGYFKFVNNSIK